MCGYVLQGTFVRGIQGRSGATHLAAHTVAFLLVGQTCHRVVPYMHGPRFCAAVPDMTCSKVILACGTFILDVPC